MKYEDKTKDQLITKLGEFLQRIVELEASETARKQQVEEELRESKEMCRALVKASSAAVTVIDLEGIIADVSQETLEMHGFESTEELIGRNIFELIAPEDREKAVKNFQKTPKEGFLRKMKYNLPRKEGTCFIGELNAGLIKDAHGKPKAFIVTTRDITELKQAEKALRESEEKYRTLTGNVNVGIYRNTVGAKCKFIEANPAMVKMFGYENREEFLATNVADLYQNSEDRKEFNDRMLRDGFVKNEELQLKKRDGSPIIGSVSAAAVKDEKGNVKYYDGIIEDITERKKVAEKLQHSIEKLHRILEETVNALSSAVEKKDPFTSGHQRRVTQLACAIAQGIDLPEEQIGGIRIAGLLHDIGKINIPTEILSKPSQLTKDEFSLIKNHSQVGYDILKGIEFPWQVAQIVFQHHERIDGSGYPLGLLGKDIHLGAKILAVADVIEAFASYRPYRPARGIDDALKEISKNRGVLYDPEIVDACLKLFREKGFKFE